MNAEVGMRNAAECGEPHTEAAKDTKAKWVVVALYLVGAVYAWRACRLMVDFRTLGKEE